MHPVMLDETENFVMHDKESRSMLAAGHVAMARWSKNNLTAIWNEDMNYNLISSLCPAVKYSPLTLQ